MIPLKGAFQEIPNLYRVLEIAIRYLVFERQIIQKITYHLGEYTISENVGFGGANPYFSSLPYGLFRFRSNFLYGCLGLICLVLKNGTLRAKIPVKSKSVEW